MLIQDIPQSLVNEFNKKRLPIDDKKISVNPLVSGFASRYEKIRNAMDYRDDEVVLRAAIQRIIKRRLLLGGKPESIAEPLILELAWARYFPNESIPETVIKTVEEKIDLYLRLYEEVVDQYKVNKDGIYEWILQLMSSDIAYTLNTDRGTKLICNFMFYIFSKTIKITGESEEIKNAQVFIAVRRSFAKEDQALLRYDLFTQFFGDLTLQNFQFVASNFIEGYEHIENDLGYPLKDKIYVYIKKRTIPFFIIKDLLQKYGDQFKDLVGNEEIFDAAVYQACNLRYKNIYSRVKTAIVRSIIFLLLTKAAFALAVEGSFESIVYGHVVWRAIALNTAVPPVLMLIVGLFIKTPDRGNSRRILERIKDIIFSETPFKDDLLVLDVKPKNTYLALYTIFGMLWMIACLLSFGAVIFILSKLQFNIISKLVFVFFLAIVSFLAYRIEQTAKIYTIAQEKQSLGSVLFDFFFMPFIQVGRQLTVGISKVNGFIFLFDLLIEAPFKELFAFFEHWFLFLRSQRENLE